MKRALILAAALSFVAAPTLATAAPYCDALSSKETLPKKYQKRGPFYSDSSTGWIIGDDQLRADFSVTDEVTHLWQRISEEFAAQGVKLVVMAPPPRPLSATSEIRSAAGVPSTYDADRTAKSYSAYIEALNEAGLQSPDLLDVAEKTGASFYFQRDTHWTPTGAAASASALAQTIGMTGTNNALIFDEEYSEKGSLSTVAAKVCGERPAAETVPAPTYAKAGDAASLLGDEAANGPAIALVGTSFSNRYQNDAYRVADALAHFTGGSVENLSVSGGGMTGAMEAFVRSSDLSAYDVVVWESPYTEPLTNISGLRQILGALLSNRSTAKGTAQTVNLSDKWISIDASPEMAKGQALTLQIAGVNTGQLHVELIDGKNEKTRIKLRKSDRVALNMRSDVWALALDRIDMSKITRIKFRLKGAKSAETATLRSHTF